MSNKVGEKLLRIYFGEKSNTIYNTSLFFKNRYEDKWITDPFAQVIIKDIDKSEVVDEKTISSPILGNIPPVQLSGGVKALLLMKNFPGKMFNASNCGDNCAKWILKLAEERDFSINLFHVMDFGDGDFEIRILNDRKLIVHNMRELLDAGVKYLQEDAK